MKLHFEEIPITMQHGNEGFARGWLEYQVIPGASAVFPHRGNELGHPPEEDTFEIEDVQLIEPDPNKFDWEEANKFELYDWKSLINN